jgi:hypothetical protein
MSGYRDRDEAWRDRVGRLAFEDVGRIRRCGPIVVMDPDVRAEPCGVFARICDVVPVREEDVRDTACILEPLDELRREARRIDEKVAAGTRNEVNGPRTTSVR